VDVDILSFGATRGLGHHQGCRGWDHCLLALSAIQFAVLHLVVCVFSSLISMVNHQIDGRSILIGLIHFYAFQILSPRTPPRYDLGVTLVE